MNVIHRVKRQVSLATGAGLLGVATLLVGPAALALSTGVLLPTSDGTYEQWTRVSSGSTHYTAVDESTCNGNTDYVRETTTGERESFGVSLASVPDGATVTAVAIVPCASRNSSGSGSSTLNVFYRWSGANSADAGGYALSGTTPAQLATTTWSGLSFVKDGSSTLEIGAVYSSGNRGARVSRLATVLTYDASAPTAPSNLSAVNVSGSQNDLSWNDNSSNETGFKIERSLNAQFGPFTQIATTTAGVVAFNDTGLTADQTYYYRVRAYNAFGNSSYTLTVYAITATAVPSNPTNLTVFASSTNATLNWVQTSTNEEGFRVERGTDGVIFAEIATKGMNAVSHIDPGLASGTYVYRVRAVNAIGFSGYSNHATTTIP